MYESYYGLNEKPFNLTPDTDFYFHSLSHQQALNVLRIAIDRGDGFIKLTGEVGTGKTLICRKLLNQLDDDFDTIYIPNPYMSCEALLQAVAREMDLPAEDTAQDPLAAINHQLIENARRNRSTIILLDEAQSLPVESLEAIRLLSNLETEKKKLVQILLFGQPELDDLLEQKSIRQLRQRIVHACHLQSLSTIVIGQYIEHRLLAAGYCGPRLFSQQALDLISRRTGGVPRLINLLCDKALMLAYASDDFYVQKKQVRQAADDTRQLDLALPLLVAASGYASTALNTAGLI